MIFTADYPNATGHNDGQDEQLPIYETSTLFILLAVYEKYTGDKSVSQQYASLLNGYARWLSDNTLYPSAQLTSVDVLGPSPNQTALAVQGTIGLKAAANITGNATYSSIAASYVQRIYNQGLGLDGATPATSKHFTYQYGNSTTWNVLFAAYSDVLLSLNTFPAAAWSMQSNWYQQVIQPGGLPWAGPIDNPYYTQQINWGLTDWSKLDHFSVYQKIACSKTLLTSDCRRHRSGRHFFLSCAASCREHHLYFPDEQIECHSIWYEVCCRG